MTGMSEAGATGGAPGPGDESSGAGTGAEGA